LSGGEKLRPFIVTERLELRPLEERDLDGPYLDWFNDPEVCRFNSHYVYPYTRDLAVEYLRGIPGSGDLVLAIVESGSGEHIGNISLQGVSPVHRHADFAIVLGDKEAWGKGFAYEAASSVVAHGFDAMNLNRISAGTSVENEGMRKLAERLGMTEEGVRREALFKDGRYIDIIDYGLLASEYRSRVPA
jgi:[ribosomal protein S5]-alanine N-acetyltransferase